jgi:arylsulfatase
MSRVLRADYRTVFAAWAVLAAAALPAAARPAAREPKAGARPNVIIVMSDDQGYGDFSCHGNPVLKTPNLDQLHNQSVRLLDFHVCPMCSPTRGELLTGVDALRNGVTSVTAGRSFIRRHIPTIADIFSASGYRTAMFGKWHLGDNWPNLPMQRGFDESVYLKGFNVTSIADTWNNDYLNGRFFHNGQLQKYPGYCTDVWFQLGTQWIRKCQDAGEPFLLYLPTNAAHFPYWVPEKYEAPYKHGEPAAFLGMLSNLDENVGKLLTMLDDSGLAENTILVYLHDNGGFAGVTLYNAGMRGWKTQYYEGGHRAACLIRWPGGRLRPAGDVDGLTQVQDLLPTLLDLCGVKPPESARFDGVSLAGVLREGAASPPDRTLVVQYGQTPKKYDSAVLWRKWRLVKGAELYDLATDPGQKKNVAVDHPEILGQMRAHYDSWWREVEPLVNDVIPVSIGAALENPTRLSGADWLDVYCDNIVDVREGLHKNGTWHVLVEREGTYTFGLRRWPAEADAAICAGVPAFHEALGGRLEAGTALPIAKARLKIGNFDETVAVNPQDKQVDFTLPLAAGSRTKLQTWFYDAQGNELCGAYFVYIRR